MKLVLGKEEIVVPQGASSRLGRRIVFLFAKENDNTGVSGSNLVSFAGYVYSVYLYVFFDGRVNFL